MAVPKFDELFNPAIAALHLLGGSASVPELENKVAEVLRLSNADINDIHKGKVSCKRLQYIPKTQASSDK